MKKVKGFCVILIGFFILCGSVQADDYPKVCPYKGSYTGKAGFEFAYFNITENKYSGGSSYSIGKVAIHKLDYYNSIDAWVSQSSGSDKAMNNAKVKSVNKVLLEINNRECTTNKMCRLVLANPEKFAFGGEKVSLSSFGLKKYASAEGIECPANIVLVYNQHSKGKKPQVFAGNEDLVNFIKEQANRYPDYNKVIVGNYDPTAMGEDYTGDSDDIIETPVTCDGILGERDVDGEYFEGTTGWLLQKIFDYMKLAAVVMLFAFSVIDYAKAIVAQDQSDFKKANKKFAKRLIFALIFFILPSLINLILKVIDQSVCGIK